MNTIKFHSWKEEADARLLAEIQRNNALADKKILSEALAAMVASTDWLVKELTLKPGMRISISSLQNCSAKARQALAQAKGEQ